MVKKKIMATKKWLFFQTDTVVVYTAAKRDCQCHKYLLHDKVIFYVLIMKNSWPQCFEAVGALQTFSIHLSKYSYFLIKLLHTPSPWKKLFLSREVLFLLSGNLKFQSFSKCNPPHTKKRHFLSQRALTIQSFTRNTLTPTKSLFFKLNSVPQQYIWAH